MISLKGLKFRIWKVFHSIRNNRNKKKFKNKDISIISMNCTGGILYHDLGLQFLSPTVNMYLKAEDFIKFCENLRYYLSIDKFEECKDSIRIGERKYPIAKLGDIHLYLVHYKSIEEAELKWSERKRRINWDKIFIINNDREGMTPELMDRFEKLPYKKVMFTHLPHKDRGNEFIYIKGYENQNNVGIVTDAVGWKGKRMIDQIDWVSLLNNV